jgi:hypothetical protein
MRFSASLNLVSLCSGQNQLIELKDLSATPGPIPSAVKSVQHYQLKYIVLLEKLQGIFIIFTFTKNQKSTINNQQSDLVKVKVNNGLCLLST